MNKKRALEMMVTTRVEHPLLDSWYTKCHNGKYYDKRGREYTEEEMQEIIESVPDYSNEWYLVSGPRDRSCG